MNIYMYLWKEPKSLTKRPNSLSLISLLTPTRLCFPFSGSSQLGVAWSPFPIWPSRFQFIPKFLSLSFSLMLTPTSYHLIATSVFLICDRLADHNIVSPNHWLVLFLDGFSQSSVWWIQYCGSPSLLPS